MTTSEHEQFRVPFDSSFSLASTITRVKSKKSDAHYVSELSHIVLKLSALQRKFYAQGKNSLLLVFQGLDAAGKDSTIKALLTGLNPAGCSVHSFKAPSSLEKKHDFLWRCAAALPEKGEIGVFNRSHYEDVLVPKVHPEVLKDVGLSKKSIKTILEQRCESIIDFERHLVRNGTVILKFWLNISRSEQKKRLLARLDDPNRNWKFTPSDLAERPYLEKYRKAYEMVLKATSHKHAPWYAIPADSKPHCRTLVANILHESLKKLRPKFPEMPQKERSKLGQYRKQLLG